MTERSSIKKCCKCKSNKNISEFGKDKSKKDGLNNYCRPCHLLNSVTSQRTKSGVITKIYTSQRCNSKRRNHSAPNYSLKELKEWIFKQDAFNEIYDNWEKSGFSKMLVPSCDRANDYLPYSLDNLKLTTWEDNNNRFHSDKRNGINNKNSKAVNQLTKSGEFIARHYSMSQAERDTSISHSGISRCCKGIIDSYCGFKWKYSQSKQERTS